MANIDGNNPPILDDTDYVDKIKNSFDAIDAHDHTPGKGAPLASGSFAPGAIVDADISNTANIAYSKLNLASSITSNDIVDGTIVDADINASAAMARTKLASGSNNHVIINDGSGVMSSEALLAPSRGGTGVANTNTLTLSNYNVAFPTSSPTPNTALVYDGANFVWSSAGGWTPFANENISGGGTVTTSATIGQQLRRVTGNGGAVTLSTTPFGVVGGWQDGLVVRLVGQSSDNTVTLEHSDTAKGAILNGACTLHQYDVIELQYDSTADRWIEITRSIK